MDKKSLNQKLEKLASDISSFAKEAENATKTAEAILKWVEAAIKVEGFLWRAIVRVSLYIAGLILFLELSPILVKKLVDYLFG